MLSDSGSFYAPRLLADVFDSPACSVDVIFVRTDYESKLQTFWNVLRQSGVRYSVNRALALMRLGRRQRLSRRSSSLWRDMPLPDWTDVGQESQCRIEPISTANSPHVREVLSSLRIDLILSTFYGEIVGTETLNIPRVGALNVHPSLLPQLRGTNPVFWALSEGLRTTGLTVHEMIAGIDEGAVLMQHELQIHDDVSHHDLYREIVEAASPHLAETVERVARKGLIDGIPQNASLASKFSKPTSAAYRKMRSNGHRFI